MDIHQLKIDVPLSWNSPGVAQKMAGANQSSRSRCLVDGLADSYGPERCWLVVLSGKLGVTLIKKRPVDVSISIEQERYRALP